MDKQTISTSLAPEIVIEAVMGNLQVKGWDRPEVSVRANPDDLSLKEQDDVVHISCRGNCTLSLPQGATLRVDKVHGEARFKQLEDQLSIGEALGPVTLRHVAETTIQSCHGDLFAKYITGDLRAERVLGNAYIREVQGSCGIEDIAGNLDLRSVESNIQVAARGNARVRLPYLGGMTYQIEAHGNAHVRIPAGSNLALHLECGSGNLTLRLPDQPKQLQTKRMDLVLGSGEAEMTISARGNLYLAHEDADEDERGMGYEFGEEFSGISEHFSEQIAQQIETQIETQMEALSRELNQQMEKLSSNMGKSGLSEEEIEQILVHTRKESERATERAQERMRRAQEKMEQKLENARRRTEQRAQSAERRPQPRKRSWNFDWAKPQPAPEKSAVSDEERLMILRMLEQKKINLDEAEQLLSALENR
jgi:hypothetical protein